MRERRPNKRASAENLFAERCQFRVAIELDDAVASRVPIVSAALARELGLRVGQCPLPSIRLMARCTRVATKQA